MLCMCTFALGIRVDMCVPIFKSCTYNVSCRCVPLPPGLTQVDVVSRRCAWRLQLVLLTWASGFGIIGLIKQKHPVAAPLRVQGERNALLQAHAAAGLYRGCT